MNLAGKQVVHHDRANMPAHHTQPRRLVLALVLASGFLAAANQASADSLLTLKKQIFRITPAYEPEAQVLFSKLGRAFQDQAASSKRDSKQSADVLEEVSQVMYSHARGEFRSGSGWLYVDPSDPNVTFIITNRHVIGGGYSVTAEPADGQTPIRAPVVYIDREYDVAVIALTKRPADPGLVVESTAPTDGASVWSAGFPKGEWSFQQGNITNAAVKSPTYGTVIGHGAVIDSGSSGGPLLSQVSSDGQYKVLGMNTWKRIDRDTNSNVAIPARYVVETVKRARRSMQLQDNQPELRRLLEHEARTLAAELSSHQAKGAKIAQYLSYAMITQNQDVGVQLAMASLTSSPSEIADRLEEFASDPADFIQKRLARVWLLDMRTGSRDISFKEINYSDVQTIGREKVTRTKFMFGGTARELGWTFEQGHWRLATFEQDWAKLIALASQTPLDSDATPTASPPAATSISARAPTSAPQQAAVSKEYFRGTYPVSLSFRLGSATKDANGDLFDGTEKSSESSGAIGIELGLLQSKVFGMGIGLNLMERGASFAFFGEGERRRIVEKVTYVQVPITFRLGYGWPTSVATVRLFGKFGGAADIAIERGADATIGGQAATVNSGYYEGHKGFNAALIIGGGLEAAFGAERRFNVGLDVLGERHLLDEWDSTAWEGANSKYTSTTASLYLKYEFGD